MKKKPNLMSAQQRLDAILDRMIEGRSPTGREMAFMDAYSQGNEHIANDLLCVAEGSTFMSDDGQFWFRSVEVDRQEDCDIISGVIGIADPLTLNTKEAHGRILVFRSTHLAIDFTLGGKEIMDAIPGREGLLDDFVEEIYNELALHK